MSGANDRFDAVRGAPVRAATAAEPQTPLNDPALAEALIEAAAFGRLSDDDVRAMRVARRRHITGAAAAVLVLAVGTGAWQAGLLAPRPLMIAHYETQPGHQLEVTLADGSKLALNGATSVEVTFGGPERTIDLERGEAFFDVTHDPDRPLVVTAAGSRTRVIGTAFDIDIARHEVKLQVYRGLVRFGGKRGGVDVAAGWRTSFSGDAALAPTRFDPTQQDWRNKWLDTDGIRLEDLVDALNRSGGQNISPATPDLAGLMLAGRFRLDNAAHLLRAIGPAYGFVAISREGKIVLKSHVSKSTSI